MSDFSIYIYFCCCGYFVVLHLIYTIGALKGCPSMSNPMKNFMTSVKMMSPQETFKKLQSVNLAFQKIIFEKKRIEQIATSSEAEVETFDPLMCSNGKRMRVFSKSEILDDLFDGRDIRDLAEQMARYEIGGVYKDGSRTVWRVSQLERNQIAQSIANTFHPKVRLECEKIQIFVINNLKGGAGKTTFAVNIAAALATSLRTSYRIAVIDLDPQGSLTDLLLPYFKEQNEDALSIGDLLENDFELDEGETFESVCRDAFLETNIPNLWMCPARETDTKFDYLSKSRSMQDTNYKSHEALLPIINAVKDEFDVILIDTPPQLNEAAFAAQYVATSSIIPLMASQNDRDSTYKYTKQLPSYYRTMFSSGHHGYDFVRLVLSNTKEGSSKAEKKFIDEIKFFLSDDLYPQFKHSEAVKRCSDHFKTLFDLSPSEYSKQIKDSNRSQFGSKSALSNAQKNVIEIAESIERDMKAAWKNHRIQAGVEVQEVLEEL